MRKTAVVIPCYNEELRLDSQSFLSFADENESIDFIFVDDGCSDSTPDMIRRLIALRPARFAIIAHAMNQGKAEAVRTGFRFAAELGYEFIGFWDADLSTPLGTIVRFVRILSGREYQAVIGSRVKLLGHDVRRLAWRHYLGRGFATIAGLLSGIPVYDSQCGAKLFRNTVRFRQVFSEPFRTKWVFDLEILIRYLGCGTSGAGAAASRIYECPLEQWQDISCSKLRWWDFLRAGADLMILLLLYRIGEWRPTSGELLGVENSSCATPAEDRLMRLPVRGSESARAGRAVAS